MVDYKVIVVTGATSGIGTAVAERFAKDGYLVVIVGRNEERGTSLEKSLIKHGYLAVFIKCDVTKAGEVEALSRKISDSYGRVDVLFNNAGVMLPAKEIENVSEAEWNNTFETNVNSVLYVTKYLKSMLLACKGCIINNGSIAGMHSYVIGRSYAYSASKSAVIQFTRQMALNYAEEGLRVNCICPGIIDTPILGDRDRREYAKRIPLGYVGQPVNVANVVAFLASEDASYLTGVVLPIDGGASLN